MTEQQPDRYPLPGAALAMLGPNWYTKLAEQWARYLVAARACGVSERDAKLIAATVQHLAQQLPQAIDVLAEARAVMVDGIVATIDTEQTSPGEG